MPFTSLQGQRHKNGNNTSSCMNSVEYHCAHCSVCYDSGIPWCQRCVIEDQLLLQHAEGQSSGLGGSSLGAENIKGRIRRRFTPNIGLLRSRKCGQGIYEWSDHSTDDRPRQSAASEPEKPHTSDTTRITYVRPHGMASNRQKKEAMKILNVALPSASIGITENDWISKKTQRCEK